MLDIKLIREKTDYVKNNLKRRPDYDLSNIDKILDLDKEWREVKKKVEELKHLKNVKTAEIREVKKNDKSADVSNLKNELKAINSQIEELNNKEKELKAKRDDLLYEVPNMLDDEVPYGESDEDNKEVKIVGEKPNFNFEPKSHIELCKLNDWFDLDTASKHSGARFFYLKNELVELEFALMQYVMDKFRSKGYTFVMVPHILRREAIGKSVSLNAFEDDLYKIDNEDLYLIATAEHSLAVLHADEILVKKELPKKYLGFSPAYRKEAGVTKDSKGIFRVHQFYKFEQFIFSTEEDSEKYHQEILTNAEEMMQELGFHYRVVINCTGDLGNFASKKYDIEVWIPSQNKYRETHSASNYRDYGARRLNCRYSDEKNELKFCHTLNNTAFALERILIAIMENNQLENGNIKIPKPLIKYIGKEIIGKN